MKPLIQTINGHHVTKQRIESVLNEKRGLNPRYKIDIHSQYVEMKSSFNFTKVSNLLV